MRMKDVQQIGLWSLATAVVVLAATGLPGAIAQLPANAANNGGGLFTRVGVLDLSAKAPSSVAPGETVAINLAVRNPSKNSALIDGRLRVLSVEFKGDPMSRVVRPDDSVRRELLSRSIKIQVAPGQTKSLDVSFRVPVEKAKPSNESDRSPSFARIATYEVVATVEGKDYRLTGFAATKKLVSH